MACPSFLGTKSVHFLPLFKLTRFERAQLTSRTKDHHSIENGVLFSRAFGARGASLRHQRLQVPAQRASALLHRRGRLTHGRSVQGHGTTCLGRAPPRARQRRSQGRFAHPPPLPRLRRPGDSFSAGPSIVQVPSRRPEVHLHLHPPDARGRRLPAVRLQERRLARHFR